MCKGPLKSYNQITNIRKLVDGMWSAPFWCLLILILTRPSKLR